MQTAVQLPETEPSPGQGGKRETGGTSDESWRLVETVQGTLLAVGAGLAGIAPRAVPFVVCLLALATLAEAATGGAGRAGGGRARNWEAQMPICAGLALLGWAGISASWASSPWFTLSSVGQIAVIAGAAGVIAALMPAQLAAMPAARRRRFVRVMPLGFLAGLGFVGAEFVSDHAVSRAVIGRFPGLMGDNAKEFVRVGDRLVGFLPFYLDRNAAGLTLLLPAVLVAMRFLLVPPVRFWGIGLMAGASAFVIAFSWSETAKLAALAGAAVWVMWIWTPRAAATILRAALILGVVLAVPLARLPAALGLDKAAWLPPSARERVTIWGNSAAAVQSAPLIGIGAQSTRFQTASDRMRVDGLDGDRRALGWHAHNFVLQTWLELGAVGAAILLWMLLAFANVVQRLDIGKQPAAAALLVMVIAIAVTGWGMWQPWLVAAMAIAAIALLAGASVEN